MNQSKVLHSPRLGWLLALVVAVIMAAAFIPAQSFADDEGEAVDGFLSAVRVGAAPGYALTPEFNGQPGDYTFEMPESVTTLAVSPTLSEAGAGGTITAKWVNQYNGTEQSYTVNSGANRNMTWFRKADMPSGTSFTLEVTKDDQTQVYTFTNKVVSHLSALAVTDNGTKVVYDPVFNANTTDYSAPVVASTEKLTVKATPYAEGYSVTIAGQPAENGQAEVTLTGESTLIPIVVQGEGFEPLTYNLTINKVPEVKVSFKTNPADALVMLRDNNGDRVLPNKDGVFTIKGGLDHTWYVTKTGYVAATGTVNAMEDTVQEVNLTTAAENPAIDKNTPAEWKNFRGSDTNMAIVDYPTPKSAKFTEFHWNKKLGTGYAAAPSQPIIVDGKLITIAGKKIYAMNLETGEIEKEGDLVAGTSYSYTPMTCVDGIILCPLSNGKIQAVNAKTLESLWVYTDALNGQALSPITVSDGYAYTGFWNGESKDANYACFSLTDEDPENPLEEKNPSWTFTNRGGFYWAGSVAIGDYIVVGTDDGTSEGDYTPTRVVALDAKTGTLVDSAAVVGDQRSTISHDPETDRYFGTTKGGQIFSFGFDKENGKFVDFKTKDYGGMSTSTPLVYKGVVYWGHSSGSNFGGNFSVIAADANTLEENWRSPLLGYPQCSILLSTAYEEEEGYVYIYSTYNNNPGGITLIKAKPDAKTTEDDNVISEEIYDADGFSQYCISSIICDANGQLFYKNDSANILSVGPVRASLDSLVAEGGSPTWDKNFLSSKENYNISVDPGTEEVKFTFEPTEGSEVVINGKVVTENTWNAKVRDGKGKFVITARSGNYQKTYTVNIVQRSEDATLKTLLVNESNAYGSAKTMSPAFTPNGTEFIVYGAGSSRTFENIWPDTTDPNATYKVFVVSGVKSNGVDAETGELARTATNSGHGRYAAYFDGDTMKLRIEVTAEAGGATRDYYLTVTKGTTADRTEAQAFCDKMNPADYSGEAKTAIEEAKAALQQALDSGTDAEVTTALTNAMKTVYENKTSQEIMDELEDTVAKATHDLELAKQDIAEANEEIAALQASQDASAEELADANARIAKLESAQATYSQQIEDANTAIQDLKDALEKQAEDFQSKLDEAQAAAEAAAIAAEEAKTEAETLKEQVEALTKKLAISEAKAQTVNKLKVKALKGKKAKITWAANKNVDGYILMRATKKNGTYKKIATIKNCKTVKYTDKKLLKGKTYFYKIQTFKKIDNKTYKGKLSAAKKVKIKK